MASLFAAYAPRIVADFHRDFPALTADDIAACVGNLAYESGGFASLQEIKPTVAGSLGGYGWAQWTGPRRTQFMSWCQTHNLQPASYEANYSFFVAELRGAYAYVIPKVMAASGLPMKVQAFELGYERAGVKNYGNRIAWAQRVKAYIPLTASRVQTPTIPLPSIDLTTPPAAETPVPVVTPVQAPATEPPAPSPAPPVPGVPVPPTMPYEPPPLSQSQTIWSAVSAVVASGGATMLAYIQSPYALVAFGIVVVAGLIIYFERVRHRKQDGI